MHSQIDPHRVKSDQELQRALAGVIQLLQPQAEELAQPSVESDQRLKLKLCNLLNDKIEMHV